MKAQLIISSDSREQIILTPETPIEKKMFTELKKRTIFELTVGQAEFTEREGGFMMRSLTHSSESVALRPLLDEQGNADELLKNYYSTFCCSRNDKENVETVIDRIQQLGFVIQKK